jgi:hypothetical protein
LAMRRCPHVRFSCAICRMSACSSTGIGGSPGDGVPCQNRRNPWRRHRMKVSGWTTASAQHPRRACCLSTGSTPSLRGAGDPPAPPRLKPTQLDQDPRGMQPRDRPLGGLQAEATAVHCGGLFDEVRSSLRPPSCRHPPLALAPRREIHRARFVHVMDLRAAA